MPVHYLLSRPARKVSDILGAINNTHIVLLKFATTQCIMHNVNTGSGPLFDV